MIKERLRKIGLVGGLVGSIVALYSVAQASDNQLSAQQNAKMDRLGYSIGDDVLLEGVDKSGVARFRSSVPGSNIYFELHDDGRLKDAEVSVELPNYKGTKCVVKESSSNGLFDVNIEKIPGSVDVNGATHRQYLRNWFIQEIQPNHRLYGPGSIASSITDSERFMKGIFDNPNSTNTRDFAKSLDEACLKATQVSGKVRVIDDFRRNELDRIDFTDDQLGVLGDMGYTLEGDGALGFIDKSPHDHFFNRKTDNVEFEDAIPGTNGGYKVNFELDGDGRVSAVGIKSRCFGGGFSIQLVGFQSYKTRNNKGNDYGFTDFLESERLFEGDCINDLGTRAKIDKKVEELMNGPLYKRFIGNPLNFEYISDVFEGKKS